MISVDKIFEIWSKRRDEFKKLGVSVNGAAICDQILADLNHLEQDQRNLVLSLREASERSGYSGEHLARMVRQGKLPNAGRKHSPKVRLGDLPRRPPTLRTKPSTSYDPDADARSLRSRLGESIYGSHQQKK